MAEPADSALVTATALLNDNRTAVCGKTFTGYRVVVLPTLPNGLAFTAKKSDGTTDAAGTEVVAGTTVAAHIGSADVDRVTVPIDFATTSGAGTGSKYVRKQLFRSVNLATGAVTEKWCYTNRNMAPLDANGAPTTVALAVNADTTALTAPGQSVTNFSQPGPLPGTYQVSELQQGYVRYIGWTAQKP